MLRRSLDVRLRGPSIVPGQLDTTAVEQLLRALRIQLRGAVKRRGDTDVPAMQLAGVSAGSVVLHLVPTAAVPVDENAMFAGDPFDGLMTTLIALHRTAEGCGDLHRFIDQPALLRGLRDEVKVLDAHDLDLELRWWPEAGQPRAARLTRVARDHVRRLLQEREEREEVMLTGRLLSINLNGTLALRRDAVPKRTYEVFVDGEERLINLRLMLGQTYTMSAVKVTRRTRIGLERPPLYYLQRMVAPQPLLPQPAP